MLSDDELTKVVKKILTDTRNAETMLEKQNLLKEQSQSSEAEIRSLVTQLLTLSSVLGLEDFNSMIDTFVASAPGPSEPVVVDESYDFTTKLDETISLVLNMYNFTKGLGYQHNIDDYRIIMSFVRGQTYSLVITPANDHKTHIIRQIASSGQELISKVENFLSIMLATYNKNKKLTSKDFN